MSTLDTILSRLIEVAQAQPNQAATIKLKGGLHIKIIMPENPTHLSLELRRESVSPSMREWYTVLDHFPWPAKTIPTFGANNTLNAQLPIHPKLL